MLILLISAIATAFGLASADYATYLGKVYSVPPDLPSPQAFFPLTDGLNDTVSAWPDSSLQGRCNPSQQKSWWATDDTFGSVLKCNKTTGDYVTLPALNYANSGAFSISLWVKPDTSALTGPFFQYVFSQSQYGLNNTQTAFAPNSINIYYPATQHPAYHLVRGVVKDSDDANVTSFLDSDGTYDNNSNRTEAPRIDVDDGQWHFVTITSQPDGSSGWVMYVDGTLAAQLPQNGANVSIDGGGPMNLTGNIVLCSRDGVQEDRHFSGSLAHLGLFNTALSASQVTELYKSVTTATSQASTATTTSPASTTSSNWLKQFSNSSVLQIAADGSLATCQSGSSTSSCQTGYFCVPLSDSELSNLPTASKDTGVCAMPLGYSQFVKGSPVPLAKFPMQNYSTVSWPIPDQALANISIQPAQWTADSLFGHVINCQENEAISFKPKAWGQNGSWAFNVWIQQRENDGTLFQYVLSATATTNGAMLDATDVYKPNQIHLYLAEASHPAHGTVRAIVRDSTDTFNGPEDEDFLDSDGTIGSNDDRDTPRLMLTDGAWHMLTLTTLPSAAEGFQIYVDGLLMATLDDQQDDFSVSGGRMMNIDGNITLCARCDLASQRFFDGKITELTMFNTSLDASTVQALYQQVYTSAPQSSQSASLAARQDADSEDVPKAPAGIFASGIGLQRPPGTSVDETSTQSGGATNSSKLSGGAVAGIVIGVLLGVAVLAVVGVFAAMKLQRRRRMSGACRLQEVAMPPMPEQPEILLSNGVKISDKFVETTNEKNAEAEGQNVINLKATSHFP